MHTERTSTATALAATLALCAIAACSARGATGEPSGPSTAAPTEGTSSASAALTTADDDDGDDDVSRAAPLRPHAQALALAAAAGGTGYSEFSLCSSGKSCKGRRTQTTFFAQFSPATQPTDGGSPCTTTTAGNCGVTTCSGFGGGGASGLAAGKLTIGGGQIGSVPIWSNSFQGYAYTFTQIGLGFVGGDTLTLTGSGAQVPAFPTQSIAAPGPIDLTGPAADAKGDYTIATTTPLQVAWTGGTAGIAVYLEGSSYSASGFSQFSCGWEASRGKGSVPASILAPLAGKRGSLGWGQQTAPLSFTAGHYSATLGADNSGAAPATFQ